MIRLNNRKCFIKNIPYEDLPSICILQILKCHGREVDESKFLSSDKYRRKCHQCVMEGEDLIVNPDKKKDGGRMIRYLNPKGVFTDMELVKHLVGMLQDPESLLMAFSNYTVGFPTEQSPNSLPLDVLLWIAQFRGLPVESRYVEEDVHRIITLHGLSEEVLRTRMFIRISNMNSQEIIRHYGQELLRTGDDHPTLKDLRSFPQFPRFGVEAVAMAAHRFYLDISLSREPLREYENILSGKPFQDPLLRETILKDRHALDLRQRFRNHIPEHLYKEDALRRMAEEEGYASDGRLSPYQYLESIRDHETFYAFGKGPAESYPRRNDYLLITGERIDGMDRSELLTYGNIHQPSARLVVLSYQEVLDTFRFYKEFRNPVSGGYEIFSDRSIRKLKILAQKPCADARIHEVRLQLYKYIVYIETFIRKRNLDMLQFKDDLHVNPYHKAVMQRLLETLLSVGRAARSHDPDTDTVFPYKLGSANEKQTEENVSMALIYLQSLCEKEKMIADKFLSLHMMRYDHVSSTFQPSQDVYDGITIQDRLGILAKGESVNEMASCIRLTSNWLCQTSYYYLVMMGGEPPFNISQLCRLG